jgi:hypothetical protein
MACAVRSCRQRLCTGRLLVALSGPVKCCVRRPKFARFLTEISEGPIANGFSLQVQFEHHWSGLRCLDNDRTRIFKSQITLAQYNDKSRPTCSAGLGQGSACCNMRCHLLEATISFPACHCNSNEHTMCTVENRGFSSAASTMSLVVMSMWFTLPSVYGYAYISESGLGQKP